MTNGVIRQINIGQEMRESYLDYAMSVIVARALPDARDGLKPVHRRIMYAMYDMGIRSDTPFKKCARIVGEVLGKYHPHGDAAVYESLVRMAQDFAMRNPLVEGQGNFGSIDGDGAAAMRYTEARVAAIGDELLTDIDKNTVEFVDNFDGTLSEPSVLPSSFPNLLVNGSSGIAVGMSTNIPPHNLGETCDALIHMLKNWAALDEIGIPDLMQFIKGPDFPTGGLIYHHIDDAETDEGSLAVAYATGRGKITMRARCHIEEMGRGKSRIIVTELPYQTNKSTLIERIAMLAREGRLEGLADLRDESDRQGLRLMIELQRGAIATDVLAQLFKLTPLQETFSIIMLALVNGEPRLLSLKQCLKVYLDHRLEIVRRRSEYDLQKARDRAHILEGLIKALDRMDEVIATIRKSKTVDAARDALMTLLDITEIQARAILDMQLRRLAALERQTIVQEHKEKTELIAYLEGVLSSPEKMRAVIAEELAMIKQAYGEPRRSIIIDDTATATPAEVLMLPQESTWITFTTSGKIGRTFDSAQPRITGDVKDPPRFILQSVTDHILYLFSTDGNCATLPVHQLPQINTPSEGTAFQDLSSLKNGHLICAALSLPPNGAEGFLFFATQLGEVKRQRLEDLPGLMAHSFKVMDIENGDELGWVMVTSGENEVVLSTQQVSAIRFKESDVRPTGMGAGGMRGIKLADTNDRVVGANLVSEGSHLITITSDGIAKTSPISEYPVQGRAGSGVIAMKLPQDSPGLASACIVEKLDEPVIILTSKHRAKTIKAGTLPAAKRAGKGDIVIALGLKESVATLTTYQNIPIIAESGKSTLVEAPDSA
ncbi:MAG: DNA gyrase subunit A [Anaerolineae bacterium]|nr:DNA gyrase subunit A [Anaerolineae bacterium]